MKLTDDKKEKYYIASQWNLMWRKFRKHKLAKLSVLILGLLYFCGIFSEFVSPYGATTRFSKYINAPLQRIHFFDKDKGFQLRPFVYGWEKKRDPGTFRERFTVDKKKIPFIS